MTKTINYENGDVYEGDTVVYDDDEDLTLIRHGKGKLTYADGRVEEGEWEYDKLVQGKQTKVDNRVWNSKGGKACKTPEDIALALEAESIYYKEDLKNPNASLYQYFRDIEGAQGAEISEMFCKFFTAYSPEQALSRICSILKGA